MAFDEAVELLVVGKDDVGVPRHLETRTVDTATFEHLDLRQQHLGVDDDAVADHRGDVRVQHAGRNELESETLTVDHQGVTRVVATLITDDDTHLAGEEVGDPALAFISPLSSDNDGRGHVLLLETTEARMVVRVPSEGDCATHFAALVSTTDRCAS